MNRRKVIHDEISFNDYSKIKKRMAKLPTTNDDELTIEEIVKIFKDKKKIKSTTKRLAVTKKLFLQYMDDNYNIDEDLL